MRRSKRWTGRRDSRSELQLHAGVAGSEHRMKGQHRLGQDRNVTTGGSHNAIMRFRIRHGHLSHEGEVALEHNKRCFEHA